MPDVWENFTDDQFGKMNLGEALLAAQQKLEAAITHSDPEEVYAEKTNLLSLCIEAARKVGDDDLATKFEDDLKVFEHLGKQALQIAEDHGAETEDDRIKGYYKLNKLKRENAEHFGLDDI